MCVLCAFVAEPVAKVIPNPEHPNPDRCEACRADQSKAPGRFRCDGSELCLGSHRGFVALFLEYSLADFRNIWRLSQWSIFPATSLPSGLGVKTA